MVQSLKKILNQRFSKKRMIDFIQSNPESFDEAIVLALADEYPESWRASWLITHVMEVDDKRIKVYVNDLISILGEKPDGHNREIIKILLKMILNDKQEGRLFNKCMNFWENISLSSSLRWTSMKFITRIIKKYPELKNETSHLFEDRYLKPLSPGIRRVIEKGL